MTMILLVALSISVIIFSVGVLYNIAMWCKKDMGLNVAETPPCTRLFSGLRALAKNVFSLNIFTLLKVLVVDILFQSRIFRHSAQYISWPMHFMIFIGVLYLIIFHALGENIIGPLVSNYQATVNPFLLLRNLSGLIVLIGLLLLLIRKIVSDNNRIKYFFNDYLVIGLIALIVITGFLLEGLKIGSYSGFQSMVDDYSMTDDPTELQALEAYWVQNYGLFSPNIRKPASPELFSEGRELHEMSCAFCHSPPQFAFISYGFNRALGSSSYYLDEAGFPTFFEYFHIFLSFIALALLPFTKMFHIIATPISILCNSVDSIASKSLPDQATRLAIELDGCSHGGTCHKGCPIRQRRQKNINKTILFGPNLNFITRKGGFDLGSRDY
jgi:nitrate reductase gamma subunit